MFDFHSLIYEYSIYLFEGKGKEDLVERNLRVRKEGKEEDFVGKESYTSEKKGRFCRKGKKDFVEKEIRNKNNSIANQ